MSTTLTLEEARTEMLDLVETAWDAGPISPVPPLTLDGNRDVNPVAGAPWARVSVKPGDAFQAGIGPINSNNSALFRHRGHVFVDIFVLQGTGITTLNALARVVTNAFEGVASSSGIWFRNTKFTQIGSDESWYHGQVITEYEHDEIK